jgi:hypothetical protein
MAEAKRVWGVVFTEAGFNDLKDVLKFFLKSGHYGAYMLCKSVDIDHLYTHVVADGVKSDGSILESEIYIPNHYIRLIGSGTEKKQIGFIVDSK